MRKTLKICRFGPFFTYKPTLSSVFGLLTRIISVVDLLYALLLHITILLIKIFAQKGTFLQKMLKICRFRPYFTHKPTLSCVFGPLTRIVSIVDLLYALLWHAYFIFDLNFCKIFGP